jgi:probable F420-dependent oxidoreductase
MTNQKPFRFGLATGKGSSRTAWRDKARQAEDLGYDILLMPDHVTTDLAPIAALAAAAETTSTLRIGSLVFDNDFRHPALLAREAATLDLLSEGRFELGLGAGYELEDYTQTGIPFDPPAVRVSRLEEALLIIQRFFTQEARASACSPLVPAWPIAWALVSRAMQTRRESLLPPRQSRSKRKLPGYARRRGNASGSLNSATPSFMSR